MIPDMSVLSGMALASARSSAALTAAAAGFAGLAARYSAIFASTAAIRPSSRAAAWRSGRISAR
jgi:hypothetical protein